MKKTANPPTKMCPHRWCRPAHKTMGLLFAVTAVMTLVISDPVVLLACFLITLPFSIGVGRMKIVSQLAVPARTTPQVRPGWARLALFLDMSLALMMLLSAVSIALAMSSSSMPHENRATAMAKIGPAAAIAMLHFGSWLFAHYMATKPRRPRRVRLRHLVPIPVKSS